MNLLKNKSITWSICDIIWEHRKSKFIVCVFFAFLASFEYLTAISIWPQKQQKMHYKWTIKLAVIHRYSRRSKKNNIERRMAVVARRLIIGFIAVSASDWMRSKYENNDRLKLPVRRIIIFPLHANSSSWWNNHTRNNSIRSQNENTGTQKKEHIYTEASWCRRHIRGQSKRTCYRFIFDSTVMANPHFHMFITNDKAKYCSLDRIL